MALFTPRKTILLLVFCLTLYLFFSPRGAPSIPTSNPLTKTTIPTTPIDTESSRSRSGGAVLAGLPPRKQQQQTLSHILSLPLREQLAYHHPYNPLGKFPTFIWQTWRTTPASPKFEERFRGTEASWTEKHPEFVHEVITDQVAPHLLAHLFGATPQVVEAYNALPLKILKADFFRYLILLARGGIYADIDTQALKPAPTWLASTNFRAKEVGLVVGIEADPDRPDWKDWYARRIQFCQWAIQSKPGHPVLVDVVANITETTLAKKAAGKLGDFDKNEILEYTGPAVWTDAVFAYLNDPHYFDLGNSEGPIDWRNFTGMSAPKRVGDVAVLPITSFSPGIGHSGAKDVDDAMAFVFHQFEGSWKNEERIEPKGMKEAREKAEREEREKKAKEKAEKEKKEGKR